MLIIGYNSRKMKKRIFITIHYLEIGGAERSLIGMLNAIDYSKYDVDLFVHAHRGEFMAFIPKQVNLLPEIGSYASIEIPMAEALRKGHIGVVAARLLAKLQYKSFRKRNHPEEGSAVFQYVADCVTPVLPSLKKYGEYDLAISFLTPHNIVKDKVLAKKKFAWIHTDYSTISVDANKELPVWNAYDKIFAVSEGVKETFISTFPSLSNKVEVFENILSESFIREQAEMGKIDIKKEIDPSTFSLLSVGRFTSAKNFDNVPFICKIMKEKGIKFKWYLIGYGGDESLIKTNIEKAGMQDMCIILGKRSNPYPYMAACDIYVQPSRFEGKAVTVREAQILCKPVIIANYKTASSQVNDGKDGIIVPQPNEEMANAIIAFLQDKQKQESIISYLRTNHLGNEKEITKLELI